MASSGGSETSVNVLTYQNLGQVGRLGNQLWEIASTLGLADTYGYEASFPEWPYMEKFSIPPDLFDGRSGTESYELVRDQMADEHCMYLQDTSFWMNISDVIWSYLQPRDRPDYGGHSTAVHVRRTDALTAQEQFILPSLQYYLKGMEIVGYEHPETTFRVFSDDIAWCRDNLPSECEFMSPEFAPSSEPNEHEIDDFVGIVACDRHIGSNSTFSWWSAFLSEDLTPVFPLRWYGPAISPPLEEANVLLPEWILIESQEN